MPYLEDLQVGDELPPLTKGPVTRQLLVEWCAAENDYYPLHYDERVAAQMKLPGTPIQGTYKYALMGQVIQRWLAATGTLNRISARYTGMNLESEVLTARARITQIDSVTRQVTLAVWVEDAQDVRATEGIATVTLPQRPQ
jgi:acyl dehydratase